MIFTGEARVQSKGETDIIDITGEVEDKLAESGLGQGVVSLFISGSTAGITTIEYEPGLVSDFRDMWERVASKSAAYQHDRRWGDGNGYSHVRASLLGASLVVPFNNGKLLLGTWQQIVVVDFDTRPRSRQIIVQVSGE